MKVLFERELNDKRRALQEMRSYVAELYAIRGEDSATARLCEKAMAVADAHS